MKLQSSIDNIYLNDIKYENGIVSLFLLINNIHKTFTAIPKDGDIPVMSSSDELSELLMSLMPYEPAIYKKLYNVVWDYINGNDVMFPIKLL